jgi:hypothetical protein
MLRLWEQTLELRKAAPALGMSAETVRGGHVRIQLLWSGVEKGGRASSA